MPVLGPLLQLPNEFRSNESLLNHFRSPKVTWCNFLSRDCLLLQAPAY